MRCALHAIMFQLHIQSQFVFRFTGHRLRFFLCVIVGSHPVARVVVVMVLYVSNMPFFVSKSVFLCCAVLCPNMYRRFAWIALKFIGVISCGGYDALQYVHALTKTFFRFIVYDMSNL